jgi:hypothetical protein
MSPSSTRAAHSICNLQSESYVDSRVVVFWNHTLIVLAVIGVCLRYIKPVDPMHETRSGISVTDTGFTC